MATAETDLDKPTEVVATIRRVGIIHPKRLVYVKSNTWTKIFGKSEVYIRIGDITQPPTESDILEFEKQNNVTVLK